MAALQIVRGSCRLLAVCEGDSPPRVRWGRAIPSALSYFTRFDSTSSGARSAQPCNGKHRAYPMSTTPLTLFSISCHPLKLPAQVFQNLSGTWTHLYVYFSEDHVRWLYLFTLSSVETEKEPFQGRIYDMTKSLKINLNTGKTTPLTTTKYRSQNI